MISVALLVSNLRAAQDPRRDRGVELKGKLGIRVKVGPEPHLEEEMKI